MRFLRFHCSKLNFKKLLFDLQLTKSRKFRQTHIRPNFENLLIKKILVLRRLKVFKGQTLSHVPFVKYLKARKFEKMTFTIQFSKLYSKLIFCDHSYVNSNLSTVLFVDTVRFIRDIFSDLDRRLPRKLDRVDHLDLDISAVGLI